MKPIKTYGQVTITKEKITIVQAEPHICIKLKSIFESIAKTAVTPFSFNNTPQNCADLEWFMARYPLAITDTERIKMSIGAKGHYKRINELEMILLPEYASTLKLDLKPGKVARPYQLTGIDIVAKVERLLIGDDLGLGKTLIGILTCLQPGAVPAMVVVQSHLMDQWEDQVGQFTHLIVHKIKVTKPYNLPPADLYIIKYTCLYGRTKAYLRIGR